MYNQMLHSPPCAMRSYTNFAHLPVFAGEYEGVGNARVQRRTERDGVSSNVAGLIASQGTVAAARTVAIGPQAELETVVTASIADKKAAPDERVSIAAVSVRVVASSRPREGLHF